MKKQIALLSNVTMDMLVQKLKKDFDIYMPAGFDTWGQEIIDTNSGLYGQKHDAVFLILDGMEARHWKDREEAFDKLELWDKLIRKLVERISDIPVFISTVDVKENRIKAVSERIYRFEWENTWYQRIQELSEQRSNVLVFDVNQIIGDIGRDNFYSEKMWYMGSMPYAKAGLQALQKEIKLLMNSAFGEKRKAIVVDFDNTLWGGVIGEDGVEGIQLSDHKEGERFYNLQHQLYEMKKRGVLLAAASKNNESDVEGVWEHPAMLLKKEDFVSRKINWEGKPLNVREMEKELNLTEGSFAFLDDNPAERNAMLAQCPEVLVLDYPEDTTQLSECAEAFYKAYFRPLAITAEDIQKTDLYLTEAKRQKEKSESLDMDDYLKKLEMKVDIHQMQPQELERVVQLCNKTNQFNLTTKRYTASDIINMDAKIYVVYTEDKYGKQGMVGVIILKQEDKAITIDTFLMSCRVMGRQLENVILYELSEYYRNLAERFLGCYIPTEKNKPVEFLYDKLGFQLTEDDGHKNYEWLLGGKMKKTDCYSEISFNPE